MKKILPIFLIAFLGSCTKEKETITDTKISDSALVLPQDSVEVPEMKNPEATAVFQINPLDVSSGKGRSVFTENGKTIFYFEQNANKGRIRIDGKDYPLNSYDFNENNYTLSGDQVKIEATNGDFKDQTGNCVNGVFPEVKVTYKDKVLNLTNVSVQDCPDF